MINFQLKANSLASLEFQKLGIFEFSQACSYIQNLKYARNTDKNDCLCVLKDNAGTCSTKHALLKVLADENEVFDLKLILGIFKMNALNTPKISNVLEKYSLIEIPEAHTYLKYQGEILDFTRPKSSKKDFIEDLVKETEIEANQITDFKVQFHKSFIEDYLKENSHIPYDLEEFWVIREECISSLQS